MPDSKSPVDQAVELFVYAPIGMVLFVKDLIPGFIEKGRERVTGQVTTARIIGQFAVQQGRVEAEKAVRQARSQAEATLSGFRPAAPTRPRAADPGAKTAAAPARPAGPATAPTGADRPADAATGNGQRPDATELAIPGYDSLSASQVVQRLAGLTADELEAVRTYEEARRARKTVLHKVAQLQSDSP